ncbi:hypothetical protein L6452_04313 [Arctium lappa]|uniref:Uncharacterized protein n=1 Tax=Arctium lappa TaxID=4217 RepID=A0ACB9FPB3_ARCLA|nr:hypothetical protein L6452_04313 [Arctium lappa]
MRNLFLATFLLLLAVDDCNIVIKLCVLILGFPSVKMTLFLTSMVVFKGLCYIQQYRMFSMRTISSVMRPTQEMLDPGYSAL